MSKILVAFFSASGVTKKVAEEIAELEQADLFEIAPESPYTAADLDWRDKQSRSTVEMNDPNCRPAIVGKVENMAEYDTIFLGFPIWWGREPSVVDTFLDAYDLSGKTVVPFFTSGGSGLGEGQGRIEKLARGARVLPGKRFSARAGESELLSWIGSLDL